MPPKRVRLRKPIPIEEAQQAIEEGLPDPWTGRKPFYTFYIVADDGAWVFIFKDTIRDKIRQAVLQNRKNKLVIHTTGDNIDFKDGVLIGDELVGIFRMSRLTKNIEEVSIVRSHKSPKISVTQYYRPDNQPGDFQMITVDIPSDSAQEVGIDGLNRSFIFWDTQMGFDLGYDPKRDSEIRVYFTDRQKKPINGNHMKEVKEFCSTLT